MPENAKPVVLLVAEFTSVEVMDGGDTRAVRFKAPDGREVAMLVPQWAAENLQAQVAKGIEVARERRLAR